MTHLKKDGTPKVKRFFGAGDGTDKQCQWCRKWFTPEGLKRHLSKPRWGHQN